MLQVRGAGKKDAMRRMKLLKGQVAARQEPVNSALAVKSNSHNNTFKVKKAEVVLFRQ